MTRDSVRAEQSLPTPKPARYVRVKIHALNPLMVRLPGGGVVAGFAVQGFTYTVGDPAIALTQEPDIGPVFPAA